MSFKSAARILIIFFSLIILSPQAFAASVLVTTEDDEWDDTLPSDGCSLREAIQAVNIDGTFGDCIPTGGGTVDTVNLPQGDYVLTRISFGPENGNMSGDLDVLVDMTLIGDGAGTTTIDASGLSNSIPTPDRVLHVTTPGTTVSVSGVTITGGDALTNGEDGGGILTFGFLTLNNVVVFGNTASSGGGIRSLCLLEINNSTVRNNNAENSGGGIHEGFGKCLQNMVIDNSTISDNDAGVDGGGIFNSGRTYISNSTINGNEASGGDGPCSGGGIFEEGGFMFDDSLIVVNTTISGNTAADAGGGIFYQFFNNLQTADDGASGQGTNGTLFGARLFNVTVADNQVTDPTFGTGGGISIGRGIQLTAEGSGGPSFFRVQATNTLIGDNSAANGRDCFGSFASGGFNLISTIDDECNGFDATGDKVGVPPDIGALQDNGGDTETHGLMTGSQAIDMGDPDGCDAPVRPNPATFSPPLTFATLARDQRDFFRPVDGTGDGQAICDIGAFEFGSFSFDVTKEASADPAVVGSDFDYTIVITNLGPDQALDVTLVDPLPAQVEFQSVTTTQGSCQGVNNTVSCDLGNVDVDQTVTVIITVTAIEAQEVVTNTVTVSVSSDLQRFFEKTAEATNEIQTLEEFLQGGGIHCNCRIKGPDFGPPKGMGALGLMFLLILGSAFGMLRRRARVR